MMSEASGSPYYAKSSIVELDGSLRRVSWKVGTTQNEYVREYQWAIQWSLGVFFNTQKCIHSGVTLHDLQSVE